MAKMRKTVFLLTLLALMTWLISGCGSRQEIHTRPQPRTEESLFTTAERYFSVGSYKEALPYYNEYLTRYPMGPYATAALMKEGRIYEIQGEYSTARTLYNHLIDRYPGSMLIPDAAMRILETYYQEGRFKEVIRYADTVMGRVHTDIHKYGIYTLLGDAYRAILSPINAIYYYSEAAKYLDDPESLEKEKLKNVAAELSTGDIRILLERLAPEGPVRGYLMYQLAQYEAEESKTGDAASLLSELIRNYPEHERSPDAQRLISEFDIIPAENRNTIGCLLPLSGPYQLYGNRAFRGIELAVSQWGRMSKNPGVQIAVEDTASDPQAAALAADKLIEKQPFALVGPIVTAETAAARAQEARIPIITLTQKDGITGIGDYVFRNFITPKLQAEALAGYAVNRLGLTRFGVLYPQEKYGETFFNVFWNAITAWGGVMVGSQSYDPNQTDFGTPIRRMTREARNNGGIEALFIPDSPRKTGLILPQLGFYDVRRVQLLGTNLWHSDTLIGMAGNAVQGAIIADGFFVESQDPAVQGFVRAFTESYGEAPGFIEAIAYDTVQILLKLMDSPELRYKSGLKEALTQLRDFPGVTGKTSFEPGGEAQKQLYLLTVEGKEFKEIFPLSPYAARPSLHSSAIPAP